MMDIATLWDDAVADLGDVSQTTAAWQAAASYLSRPDRAVPPATPERPDEAFVALKERDMMDQLADWYLEQMDGSFPDTVQLDLEQAWVRMAGASGEDDEDTKVTVVGEVLDRIGHWLAFWQDPLQEIWPDKTVKLRHRFLARVFFHLPASFTPALELYISRLLLLRSAEDAPPTRQLATLVHLLERYDAVLFSLIYGTIERHIEVTCKGVWDRPMLGEVTKWLNEDVKHTLVSLYGLGLEGGEADALKLLKPMMARFENHVNKTICAIRVQELFDIIVDYPDSSPALADLKVSLERTDSRTFLVTTLKSLNNKRLLHPGADTRDILSQYVSMIRALRIVDPQGVLLSRVASPVRAYLRAREDTIRCIISSLIEEGSDLIEELNATAADNAAPIIDANQEAEDYTDGAWVPDPIDAPPDFYKSRRNDIIQILVSIYDTKEVFIKELQVLLAQRLLAIRDYDLDREIKNIETLKLRFGEASMQGCEVMLRDMQDSKRIDNSLHDAFTSPLPLHATIVSRMFWPSFQASALKLPGQLGKIQSEYIKTYAKLKPDKKLKILSQLGTVSITVELKDRTLELDVSPLQAGIIELFAEEDTWDADDLGATLGITDSAVLLNALHFWANQGVVRKMEDGWKLLEESVPVPTGEEVEHHMIEDTEPAVQSVQAKQIEDMRTYWTYIKGMLTNLKSMPLLKIHAMLNMVVPQYKSAGKTMDELTSFLEAMQAEGVVEKSGNEWKIVRK